MHTGCVVRLLFLSLLAISSHVAGHGYVSGITVDDNTYQGNPPSSNGVPSYPSPIRRISDLGPVKGANSSSLSCGPDAQIAPVLADAEPGSIINFRWSSGTGGNWIHKVGPILSYLARCDAPGCATFNASSARWFKIDDNGLLPNGTWAMEGPYDGLPTNVTLPVDLAPGEYLLRQELIALHAAMAPGGAEFYPSCAQLRVGGSGTGVPAATVSFPGAYNDTDPGILMDAYDMGNKPYIFPGPPMVTLVAENAVASDGESCAGNSTTTMATPSPSSSAPSETTIAAATPGTSSPYELLIYPRRVSRIMRSLH